VSSRLSSPGIWPQEIRFFPKELSLLTPIIPKSLEFPAGQVSSWSSSYPGCGFYLCTGPGPLLGRIGSRVYTFKPRDLVLVPPGAPVCWFAEKADSSLLAVHFLPSILMVDMNNEELTAFLASFRFGREEEVKVRSLGGETYRSITNRLQAMLAERQNSSGERGLKWKVSLGEILLPILHHGSDGRVSGESFWTDLAWQRLPKVLVYLHKNCREDLYAEKILKDLGLPGDFLSTKFPEIMGQRWNRYLLDYRIRLAVGLLRQKNARISFVAQECGFSTLSHFNASFRKVMGMAPRDFHKSCESRFASEDGVGKPRRIKLKAFTLVELLVTISILGLLAALSIPAIRMARESGSQAKCLSNIKQLTTAQLAAAADNNGRIFTRGWAHDANGNVTNGRLWINGYVQDPQVFLCPHGRKPSSLWFGAASCDYSVNVTPELGSGQDIYISRLPGASRVILLLEEAVITAAQQQDSCALLQTNLPPTQGDRLFTESTGISNHRKKGCVSFYDGSAAAMSKAEWENMLNTQAKRRVAYGVQ
jgi:prepilin-type N-terminal cleavage/methylation domain-containing protein